MKKRKIISYGIAAIVIVAIIAGFMLFNKQEKYEDYITIESFSELDDSNPVSLTLGREGCSWCNRMKPILTNIAKDENIPLYYMDVSNLDKDHNYEIPTKCADYKNQTLLDDKGFTFGTPLHLTISNGKITDCYSGYADQKTFTNYLKRAGIVKK